jgi:Fic family protein
MIEIDTIADLELLRESVDFEEEQEGWAFLASRTGTTQSEYARTLGVTARTAQRHLTHFVELGLLRRVGAARATEYLKP